MINLVVKHRSTLFYGVVLAAALLLLKWLELQWLVFHPFLELYTGGVACLFTLLGIWITLQFAQQPPIEVENVLSASLFPEDDCQTSERSKLDLQLSKREVEVLYLMAEGLSNQQIADSMFVSVNTVKTHVSHLFEKLEVSRRTQAIDKAKKLNIIP